MFGSLGKVFAAVNPVAALGTALGVGESALAYKGQKDANESNERIAKDNRSFQERMVNQAQDFELEQSNTAYQRSMADMKKAGLNPILAYKQGGASTPIGKTAPGSTAVMQNEFGGMSGSPISNINTASSIMSQAQQREKVRYELDQIEAYTALTVEQQKQVKETIENIDQDTRLKAQQTSKTAQDAQGQEFENVQRKIIADFLGGAEFAGIAKYIGVNPNTLAGIIRTFFLKRGK